MLDSNSPDICKQFSLKDNYISNNIENAFRTKSSIIDIEKLSNLNLEIQIISFKNCYEKSGLVGFIIHIQMMENRKRIN